MTRTPRLTSLGAFAAESIDVGIGDAADCELAGFAEVIAVVGSEPRPRTPRLTSLGAFAAESIDVGIGGDVTRESTADECGGDAADCELAGFAEVIAVVGSEPRPRTPRLTVAFAFAEPFGNAGGRSYGCLSRRTPCGAD